MKIKFYREGYRGQAYEKMMYVKEISPGVPCPFCLSGTFQSVFPGDFCGCGAIVAGIYGDRQWPTEDEE